MSSASSKIARSAVGSVVLLCTVAGVALAQPGLQPVAHLASVASGSISGIVQDDRGQPVAGATVSALGTTSAFAVTDRSGRFDLRTLSPGPYLLRAHSA